jgi:hypothetical protein
MGNWYLKLANDTQKVQETKIVGPDGEPLVVYHGSSTRFDRFDRSHIDEPNNYQGFYFTPSESYARAYSYQPPRKGVTHDPSVKAFHLNIRNPFLPNKPADEDFIQWTLRELVPAELHRRAKQVAHGFKKAGYWSRSQWLNYLQLSRLGKELRLGTNLNDLSLLKRLGYDGVLPGVPTWEDRVYDHSPHNVEEVVAFDPDQVVPVEPAGTKTASGVVDFSQDAAFHHLFYRDPTPEEVGQFAKWLGTNRDTVVRLYHGTAAEHDVVGKGLLPTSRTRRRSYQSTSGYVYLSVYPGMAKSFASMGYPGQEHKVYAVELPIRTLLADADQLRNARMWGGREVGNSLAESLAYGHGARVRGAVLPQFIREHQEPAT